MKKRKVLHLFCLGTLLGSAVFFLSPSFVRGDIDDVKHYRIGVLAPRGPEICLKQWSNTAQYLSEKIKNADFEIVPLQFSEVLDSAKNEKLDFFLVNPAFYAELEILYGVQRIATLKDAEKGKSFFIYGGVIFTRADREDIRKLEDFRGKQVVAADEKAFGGWIVVLRELKRKGMDPRRDFSGLNFTGLQDEVVYAVRDRKADVGVVRTGVLEVMTREGKIDFENFKVIYPHGEHVYMGLMDVRYVESFPLVHSTNLYPGWPFAKSQYVDNETAEKVAVALLSMEPDHMAAITGGYAGWTVPVNYQSVHDCLKELRIGIYRDFGKVTLRDLFRQYWPWILAIMVLFVSLSIAVFIVLGLNRILSRSRKKLEIENTERRKAEAKIQSEKEFLNDVLNSLTHPFYVIDANTYEVVLANKHAKGSGGLEGRTCYAATHQADTPCGGKEHGCPLDEIRKTGRPAVLEHRHFNSEGEERFVEVHGYPIFDAEGKLIQMIEYSHDITEQKRAQEDLLREKEINESMLKSLPGVFYMFTPEGRFVRWNKNFETVLGYSTEEIAKIHPTELFEGNDQKLVAERIRQVFLQGEATVEADLVSKDGKKTPYYLTGLRVRILGETYLIGVGFDIIDRRQAQLKEKKLFEETRALAEAEKRKSEKLERAHNLMIGREERMIQLKHEVNALLEALGKTKKYDLRPSDNQLPDSKG